MCSFNLKNNHRRSHGEPLEKCPKSGPPDFRSRLRDLRAAHSVFLVFCKAKVNSHHTWKRVGPNIVMSRSSRSDLKYSVVGITETIYRFCLHKNLPEYSELSYNFYREYMTYYYDQETSSVMIMTIHSRTGNTRNEAHIQISCQLSDTSIQHKSPNWLWLKPFSCEFWAKNWYVMRMQFK